MRAKGPLRVGIGDCPICGRSGKNRGMERGKDYVIYRCSYCGGDFAQTALSLDYRQEYETEGAPFQDGRKLRRLLEPERELKEAKLFANFKQALRFLKALSSNGRLLDIGCGTGVFPKLAEQLGLKVYALDPATEAIKYAAEKFGLKNTVAGTIEEIPPEWQGFDFITCFEVLEHVQQPRELVKKIYRLLTPGGYFIMSVPNRNRLDVKLGRRAEWDYPPNHLTRWSKEVLNSFLTRIGFTNVTVKIDGINRLALGNILLPSRLNQKITRRKLNSSVAQIKGGFFLYNPLWKFVQKLGDSIAFLSQPLGRFYGTQLIAFAQKPPSGI
jgi:SAM-dependent methyltransferase